MTRNLKFAPRKLNLIIITNKANKQLLSVYFEGFAYLLNIKAILSITYSNLKSSAKRITYHSNYLLVEWVGDHSVEFSLLVGDVTGLF